MKNYTLFKTGSIAFIILGLLHLMAHFGNSLSLEPNQLMQDMQDYKINLFGEHNLLQFHTVFSIMMGFLISAFGLQNLLCTTFIVDNKKALLSSILISAIAFIVALLYFHILAYGFILFSFLCYLLTYYKQVKQQKLSRVSNSKDSSKLVFK